MLQKKASFRLNSEEVNLLYNLVYETSILQRVSKRIQSPIREISKQSVRILRFQECNQIRNLRN